MADEAMKAIRVKTDAIGGDPGGFRTGLELSIDHRNAGGKIETHSFIDPIRM